MTLLPLHSLPRLLADLDEVDLAGVCRAVALAGAVVVAGERAPVQRPELGQALARIRRSVIGSSGSCA